MVNNETQKENEMALEDVLTQKWVDSAKEIATLRAENDRLEDEAYTARQAARGENALRLEAERERDTLRAGLEDHRLAHDDAKAAWEKECSERDILEEIFKVVERERDEARAAFRVLDSWSLVFSYTPAYIREAIDAARDLK
tara:strand:+ start:2784 stop:3209 length:426 start_codon:yes stop_codon:yes gene_type:complete